METSQRGSPDGRWDSGVAETGAARPHPSSSMRGWSPGRGHPARGCVSQVWPQELSPVEGECTCYVHPQASSSNSGLAFSLPNSGRGISGAIEGGRHTVNWVPE